MNAKSDATTTTKTTFTPCEVAYTTVDRSDRLVTRRKVIRTQAAFDRLREEAVEILATCELD